ncbi:hypothetical protein HAX54_027481 [Datura stramonium]|uniref:Uncharacterized protein n=1 Tax=Datura stramonium TaxID=4076 RepID=A0ABS8V3P8_DATST|nr:hypothetical protein [Datura stramonium]
MKPFAEETREVERTIGAVRGQGGGGDPRTEHVARKSHHEARENGTDEGGDSGSADVSLSEIEVLTNDFEKWRDGENY